MDPKIEKYLFDIHISIQSIDEYIGLKKDFIAYQTNKQLRRAVERELEIIGEAANRILQINSTIEISDARKIVDLRNWVIYGYDKVDDVIIWGVVCNYLPKLKLQVDNILKTL